MPCRTISMMEQLKVSTKSNPNSVAGAMAGVLRQSGAVEVQVVGAGALNQAIKAVAIARGYVASGGLDLVCVPSFADIEIDGERRTAIRLVIEDRQRRQIDPSIELPDVDLTDSALEDLVPREPVAPPANGHRLN
jgi:stage V sporulation protein S